MRINMKMYFSAMRSTKRSYFVGSLALLAIAAAGCGDATVPDGAPAAAPTDTATPVAPKAVPHSRSTASVDVPHVTTAGLADQIPAQMLPRPVDPPFGPAVIQVTNAWEVSDGSGMVVVYAGSAGNNSSEGVFAIVRDTSPDGNQSVKFVDVGGVGAVSIVNAPTGAAVESSAQTGKIPYQAENGTSGLLNLSNDTVSPD